MFFFEKQSVSIDRQGQAYCPTCHASMESSHRVMPLRYSVIAFARVLILASAFTALLWLFANPGDIFPTFDVFSEKVRGVLAAVLCVGVGFLVAYLAEMLELALLYRTRKQKLYGFRCRSCKKSYVGVEDKEEKGENIWKR